MKQIICSDVHGNLEALQAVMAFTRIESPDEIYHLGDIVGYGANPQECMDLLATNRIINLAGNHDHAVVGLLNIEYFNFYAKGSILWTQRQLGDRHLHTLKSLPLFHRNNDIMMVHATPEAPREWNYIFTFQEAETSFAYLEQQKIRICFVGHSHQPGIFEKTQNGKIRSCREQELRLDNGRSYIINVGAVGQPRDGIPDACVGVFDTERSLYSMQRVPYPVNITQQKMMEADIDPFLIQRLAHGR